MNLNTSVQFLKGVGPERSKLLDRLGINTLEDVFYFFPRRYEDRSQVLGVSQAQISEKATITGVVTGKKLMRLRGGRTILKVSVYENKKTLFAMWFNQSYLANTFLPQTRVVLTGRIEKSGSFLQMTHPDYEILKPGEISVHSGRIVPVYPLTEDLGQKGLRQLIYNVVHGLSDLKNEIFPEDFRLEHGFVDLPSAFREMHFPSTENERLKAYRRLVFDEFMRMQLWIRIRRQKMQSINKSIQHQNGRDLVSKMLDLTGFEPTEGQKKAMEDVMSDMSKPRAMNRLVQGDVGSGKTLVAAAALVYTAANGFQGALMAPTEVLAQQHYFNLSSLLEPLGIRCAFLSQNVSKEDRTSILSELKSGEIRVAIGTHALIQNEVLFKNLGLAIIDEQHKFGVMQRAALKQKSQHSPHCLLLTATPIPRTLAITLYGESDISVMTHLPKGRVAIKTMRVSEEKRGHVYGFVEALMGAGKQGYFICPLIDSKYSEAKTVLASAEQLKKCFPQKNVGVLHGKMKSDDKNKIMKEFRDKKIDVLVSTVVVEVGVDVPNAVFMIIENAEKFGLSQLHQLRGRIGRGQDESYCFLFSSSDAPETEERLNVFEKTSSGFVIAEEDLKLRGAGDILGERQHGLAPIRIGDIHRDMEILNLARDCAAKIIEEDPHLKMSKHKFLKRWLFDDQAKSMQPPLVEVIA